ncbi:MAG: NAD(P)H-dependent oxidoreductase [Actinomycetota bacterium]|nr:NAD(P)H-dependent oxidoreductase [Actinomycetota bacterium]
MSVRIVGIGGSVDAGSQSDAALRAVLAGAEQRGATVQAFTGSSIDFPPYFTGVQIPAAAGDYIDAVRAADAVVISSPGYHGTISGLVKNALDYLEELRAENRPYLDGRAVGLVAVAAGWQATVNTLATLRQIAHTLRGWPTPYGLALNTTVTRFAADLSTDVDTSRSVDLMAAQLADFASKMGTSAAPGQQP